jgi:Acetyltransferase (GNAT) domain
MNWKLLSAKHDFGKFVTLWDDLNHDLYRDHPLLSSSFVEPLVKHFATENEILAVHWNSERVDAMLLLTPGKYKWKTFVPSQAQIAPVLISDATLITSLIHDLPISVLAIDLLCQDPNYSASNEAESPKHEQSFHATTINIDISTGFDEYWNTRSKKLRQNIRRAIRASEVAKLNPSLRVLESEHDVTRGLDSYSEMESKGWKAQGGTAIRLDTAQGKYYSEMLRRFVDTKGVEIHELYLGSKLAASQIVLRNNDILITLKTTHDEEFSTFSPGNVLDYLLLEREFLSRRANFVEYYTNASPELLRWGSGQRVISNHRWYRWKWVRLAVDMFRKLRRAPILSA